jgi:hypothetical protein
MTAALKRQLQLNELMRQYHKDHTIKALIELKQIVLEKATPILIDPQRACSTVTYDKETLYKLEQIDLQIEIYLKEKYSVLVKC